MSLDEILSTHPELWVHQKRELAELIGFETRNKYAICDSQGQELFFAAEQQKGLGGMLMRQFFGHWRTFDIHIFDQNKNLILRAHHPFRFLFQRLEVYDGQNKFLGALQGRFALIHKKFDVESATGKVTATVESPIWKIWTFPFMQGGREVALIAKKWAGLLSEAFTDKDRFQIKFSERSIDLNFKKLMVAAAIFIDLQYFEQKARS